MYVKRVIVTGNHTVTGPQCGRGILMPGLHGKHRNLIMLITINNRSMGPYTLLDTLPHERYVYG